MGCQTFTEARSEVSRYINDHHTLYRPHTFNGGLHPPQPRQDMMLPLNL